MFKLFHLRKLRYEKGQMIPIFIVILVVIIIMSMITVNLSKIALTRTDVSNAADAGALAGGSVMAGVFNQQAVRNSQMIANYWMGYAEIATTIAMTIALYMTASAMCCGVVTTGAYVGLVNAANTMLVPLTIAIYAFSQRQYWTYRKMRFEAQKGRLDAIKQGYRYAFLNSGIGQKLISHSVLRDIAGNRMRGDITNYADTFNVFQKAGINELSAMLPVIPYAWRDGQGRLHTVIVRSWTDSVGNYRIRMSVMPIALMMTRLAGARGLGLQMLMWAPSCLIPGLGCGIAWGNTKLISVNLLGIIAGLLPGATMSPVGGGLTMIFDWVDDIVHNRKFKVLTTQTHGAHDYGIWNMKYPPIGSSCMVDFEGKGDIYTPRPQHDASIESVDLSF